MKKIVVTLWRDSRAAVYAVTAAAALSTWSVIHAHGFPKSKADWTVLAWAAVAAAAGAAGRYVDPFVATVFRRVAKASVGGRSFVTQEQIAEMVSVELAKAQNAAKTAQVEATPAPAVSQTA